MNYLNRQWVCEPMVNINLDKYNIYSLIDQGSYVGAFLTTIDKQTVKSMYDNYVLMCRRNGLSGSPAKFAQYINDQKIMNRVIIYVEPDYLHLAKEVKRKPLYTSM